MRRTLSTSPSSAVPSTSGRIDSSSLPVLTSSGEVEVRSREIGKSVKKIAR